jgi:serine/threonine protein kinase
VHQIFERSDSLDPDFVVEDFEKFEELGEGGQSTVYHVRYRKDISGRTYALKVYKRKQQL